MKELLKENDIVFLDAALIYEAEVENDFDYVVLITANNINKIQRICKQRDLTEKEIKKRMANQIPDEIKREWADFVFENNGSLSELKLKAEFFINILKSIRGKN
jgi:dephospho-CoA kinase